MNGFGASRKLREIVTNYWINCVSAMIPWNKAAGKVTKPLPSLELLRGSSPIDHALGSCDVAKCAIHRGCCLEE